MGLSIQTLVPSTSTSRASPISGDARDQNEAESLPESTESPDKSPQIGCERRPVAALSTRRPLEQLTRFKRLINNQQLLERVHQS